MAHLDALLSRLPRLYRDGERVRWLLGAPAVHLEELDEDLCEVQRAHHFDATYRLDEAARLAAVLGMAPEPWQTLGTFRAWVHALRDARLRYGTVTVDAVVHFVGAYLEGHEAAVRLDAVGPVPKRPAGWRLVPAEDGEEAPDVAAWRGVRAASGPVLVETPLRRRTVTVPAEPLRPFTLAHRGVGSAPVGFHLVGLPTVTEAAPLIANLTTGRALVWTGAVPTGARLWLRPQDDGTVRAELDGRDVTDRLASLAAVSPGEPWAPDAPERPARALRLARGENRLWFLPLAHYDAPGLDRALLALADLQMEQGRFGGSQFDGSQFDRALFYQDPAVALTAAWDETQPARFEVRLPAGALRRRVRPTEDPIAARAAAVAAREALGEALRQGVGRLRGAGIEAEVHLDAHAEAQPQRARLAGVLPRTVREGGPTGIDRLPDAGALFDVTDYGDSTFR